MANPNNWHYGRALPESKLKWPCSPVWFKRVGLRSIFARTQSGATSAEIRQGQRFQMEVAAHFAGQIHEGWFVLEEVELHASGYRDKLIKRFVDVVCINPIRGEVIVLECKRTYVVAAYEQLWEYMSLLRVFFDPKLWKIGGVVICRGTGRHMGQCVGPTDWLMPGKLDVNWWDGHDLPRIGAIDWGMGCGWQL